MKKKNNLVTSILNLKISNSFKYTEANFEMIKQGNVLNCYSFETTCTTVLLFVAEVQREITNLPDPRICSVHMTNEWIN